MSKDPAFPKDIFTSLPELMAMEKYNRLFGMQKEKRRVKTVLGGPHASKMRGRGLDFEEVRHYVNGDDIRTIDWKVTARTKKTHTRVFSEEKEKPALIIVDQSISMFFGSKKRTKSVAAAEIAALIAFRIQKEGDRVGGIVFSDQGTDIIFPKRDRRNLLRLLEKIVQRNHELKDLKETPFQEILKEVTKQTRNLVTHDFTIFLISDFNRHDPQVVRSLSLLAGHNDLILVKVYDPLEREIPSQKIIVGDQVTQISVTGTSKQIREKFTEGFDQKFRDFETQLKRHQIPLILIDTVRGMEDQLKELFKNKIR